jgi:general secretion pathway protein B
MSFILDALRKSEAERQRQDGPTLLEMRPSRPQRRLPLWVIGLGALLLVNIAVLLWFLLRTPAASVPARALTPPSVATTSAPAASAPVARIAPAPGTVEPPAAPVSAAPTASRLPAPLTPPPTSTASSPSSARPVPPASTKPAKPQLAPADRTASLPDYSHVSAGLPALRLDLHSYSDQPSQRYALINMHKVREGDTLPEGARVLQILPDGVVLSYQGTEFVLGRN